METLILAKDGIFPITKDKEGKALPHLPASGFNFPGTIQGEGKLNGIPSLFVRLAGCNLQCCWKMADGSFSECDTAYAAYRISGSRKWSAEDICSTIRHNTGMIRHIVITGGEPFVQEKQLISLCDKIKRENNYHITIETNGTLFSESLAGYIDFFSISPKLASSEAGSTRISQPRINVANLQTFIRHARTNGKDFQLKFVCSCDQDIVEIKSVLTQLEGWKNEDILLMPLGGTAHDVLLNTEKTLTHCIRNGWRYCDRLHLSLFGAKQGV